MVLLDRQSSNRLKLGLQTSVQQHSHAAYLKHRFMSVFQNRDRLLARDVREAFQILILDSGHSPGW